MTRELICVFLGGGLGSVIRYLLSVLINGRGGAWDGFPWGTFFVNITGCLLIGIFYVCSSRFNLSAESRLFLTVGLCGGYTTFSTFSNESLALLREGMYATSILYIGSSVVVGLAAVWLGMAVAQRF